MLLDTGEVRTVEEILKGIAIASGNDAAVAMAEYLGGTVDAFVEMIKRITYRLLLIPSMASDTAEGMPVNAMTQLMMLDTPIRKMMIPVISALSRKILGSSETLIDL